MKHTGRYDSLLSWFCCAVTCAGFAVCQEPQPEKTADTPEKTGANLEALSLSMDLGDKLSSLPFEYGFQFANAGDEVLKVRIAKKSCGCTGFLRPGSELRPGQTGDLVIDYSPKKGKLKTGLQSYVIVLQTNDPSHSEVVFRLDFRLVPPVAVLPPVLDFGVVDAAQRSVSSAFEIICYRNDSLPTVRSVECASPAVTVQSRAEEETEYGRRYVYRVVLAPEKMVGQLHTSIVVWTDSYQCPVLELPIRADRALPVHAQPKAILFGLAEPGTSREMTTSLSSNVPLNGPLRVVCRDPRILSRIEREPGKQDWLLRVTLNANEPQTRVQSMRTVVEVFDAQDDRVGEVEVFGVIAREIQHLK